MRDSCRLKAMLATSCLMYPSHSSVRFTSTRAPNNSCLSRAEQCSALTKARLLEICPRKLSLFLLREKSDRIILSY